MSSKLWMMDIIKMIVPRILQKKFPKVEITLISTNKLGCVHSKLKGANGAPFKILLGSLFFVLKGQC